MVSRPLDRACPDAAGAKGKQLSVVGCSKIFPSPPVASVYPSQYTPYWHLWINGRESRLTAWACELDRIFFQHKWRLNHESCVVSGVGIGSGAGRGRARFGR